MSAPPRASRNKTPPRRPCEASRQRGQAMLLTVLLLGAGIAGGVYTFATRATSTLQADAKTAAALAMAREALIGRAAADQNMPGSLPCPDFDDGTVNPLNTADDGVADLLAGNNCPSYIGRLPWRTLGLPDLRDGSGERLWYALSPNFRDDPSASPLNSDTAGQLTITGSNPASNVIAIVFAPGAVVGTQARSNTAVAACSTTGTSILESRCPANYLDDENGNGMPPADSTFTTAMASEAFNDKLLPVTSDALFNVLNVRVAKEATAGLEAYRTVNLFHPFASPYANGPPYDCVVDTIRGRFPRAPESCGGAPWGASLPTWFAANNWNLVTHYALARPCADLTPLVAVLPPGLGRKLLSDFLCGVANSLNNGNLNAINVQLANAGLPILAYGADDFLYVTGITGANGARTVVIVTGRALTGQNHAPACALADCHEDAANKDGDATYQKPSRFPTSNDRMALSCEILSACPTVP